MSRLDQALEKAAQLRKKNTGYETKVNNSIVVPHAAIHDKPFLPPASADVAAIKIDNPFLVTLKEPASPITEEYRKLKTVIMKLTQREHYLNTIMVTSAVSAEGKSITALNLAITMAQEYDHTILLVDADVRKPSLHQYLNSTANTGLTDCLVNGNDLSSALIRTGIGRLSFLPSGRQIKDPAELLSSNRMKEFLLEIKNRYPDRYIIIDAPPVLSCAETLSLGHMVDGILFVVMEGIASLDNIQEALGLLKDANVLGLVYNNVSVEAMSGYYSHSYQRYGHRTAEEKGIPA